MIKDIYRFFLKKHNNNKIKNLLNINEYLNKFDYNIDNLEDWNEQSNTDYIWQLWFQGEKNAPDIVKICLDSVKRFHSDKKIIVLDDTSIEKYIEVPPIIKEKYLTGVISKAHYSDYIRTCLLVKYGGVWIDSTVLLTGKIPNDILNSDFFVFKNPIWYENRNVPSESLFKIFLSIEKDAGFYGSNWFIVSKPNNLILILQKKLLEEYWTTENKLRQYFLYHFFISKSLIKNKLCCNIFENMYSLPNRAPHILQSMLNCEFDVKQFEEIKNISTIHKITYKLKKIKRKSFFEYISNQKLGGE